MKNITFAERLKEARKSAKLSQEALAKKIGRTKSTISRWESGERNPKMFEMVELEKILGVTAENLLYGTEEIKKTTLSEINRISSQLEEPRQKIVLDTASSQLKEQKEIIENAKNRERKILGLDSKPIDITKVPGYMPYEPDKMGTAPILGEIAAGYNIMAEENFDGMMPVSAEYAGRDDVFWLNIKGKSMESLIHDGSFGLFEHSDDIYDGRIGAVMSEDGDWITVKRIYHNYDENGYILGLTLVPENEECKTIEINEYNPGKIIGTLLEVKQFF